MGPNYYTPIDSVLPLHFLALVSSQKIKSNQLRNPLSHLVKIAFSFLRPQEHEMQPQKAQSKCMN